MNLQEYFEKQNSDNKQINPSFWDSSSIKACYTFPNQIKTFNNEKTFTKDVGGFAFFVTMLLIVMCGGGFLFASIDKESLWPGILFLCFGFILILVLSYNFFLNDEFLLKVKVNHDYLQLNGKKIPWGSISEIGFMTLNAGRRNKTYLVIIADNSSIIKLNCFNMDFLGIKDFQNNFANYAEHFRNLSAK